MLKKWREENERSMREFPTISDPIALTDQGPAAADAAPPVMTALAPPAGVPAETSPDLANRHAGAEETATPAGTEAAVEPAAAPSPATVARAEAAEEEQLS